VVNVVFWGAIIVGGFLTQYTEVLPFSLPVGSDFWGISYAPGWLAVEIFVWNFVLSAFVLLGVLGAVFFGFPLVILVYRGLLWGFMLQFVPTDKFFLVLPTLFLEGLGYVLAGVAGITVGLAWLWPKLVFPGKDFSRSDALAEAFVDGLGIFVLVAIVLLVAAVVEVATIGVLLG